MRLGKAFLTVATVVLIVGFGGGTFGQVHIAIQDRDRTRSQDPEGDAVRKQVCTKDETRDQDQDQKQDQEGDQTLQCDQDKLTLWQRLRVKLADKDGASLESGNAAKGESGEGPKGDTLRKQLQTKEQAQDQTQTQDQTQEQQQDQTRQQDQTKERLWQRLQVKLTEKDGASFDSGVAATKEYGSPEEEAGLRQQLQERTRLRIWNPEEPTDSSCPPDGLPDLRIGRWWYRAAPRVGQEVDFFFEIENAGYRVAHGPILWEVTCHNWGFWNPVLNRLAVSYSHRWLLPGQSKVVHISFPMTRHTHNLRLMVDPSDHLGYPDNPPFGQKAKLAGWIDLRNGHIRERNERNNAKWVCIKVFPLTPEEITEIVIPIVKPIPGAPVDVEIQMDEELVLPDGLELGLPSPAVGSLLVANIPPMIDPVLPGQVIAKLALDPDDEEEEVVLLAKLMESALLERPVRFRVRATAMGPDGQPIVAEVTVVLVTEPVQDDAITP